MTRDNTWDAPETFSRWIADSEEWIKWQRQAGHTGRKPPPTEEQRQQRREQASRWREKHREQIREHDRRRYAEDPEYRERRRAAHRAYYHAHREQRVLKKQGPTPGQREKVRQQDKRDARARERFATDPEYRQHRREMVRQQHIEHPKT